MLEFSLNVNQFETWSNEKRATHLKDLEEAKKRLKEKKSEIKSLKESQEGKKRNKSDRTALNRLSAAKSRLTKKVYNLQLELQWQDLMIQHKKLKDEVNNLEVEQKALSYVRNILWAPIFNLQAPVFQTSSDLSKTAESAPLTMPYTDEELEVELIKYYG